MILKEQWGGFWTVQKKKIVKNYLDAYSCALKNQPFQRWYIDAFAGTGYHDLSEENEIFLFDEGVENDLMGFRLGSASLALQTKNPFHKYVFIEKSSSRFQKLTELKRKYPERKIECINSDANESLQDICDQILRLRSKPRCVVFLDPYGMQLEWETLHCLSKTQVCDIWYLFPTNAVNRMLTQNAKMDEKWTSRLTTLFGTSSWKDEFYVAKDQSQQMLPIFDCQDSEVNLRKNTDLQKIERYIYRRLTNIFEYVSKECMPLYNTRRMLLYSLFFLVSNPDEKAKRLGRKISNAIIKNNKEIA